jgi:hypothetical protein
MANERLAKVQFSLSFLEKWNVVYKSGYNTQTNDYTYRLTNQVKQELQDLVQQHKGDKEMACIELLLRKCAQGESNALTTEAIEFHARVLHVLAFRE